jgi:hypothetical protein
MRNQTSWLATVLLAGLMASGCGSRSDLPGGETTSGGPAPTIKLLSNRADLISGDDALVEVVWPEGVVPSQGRVLLNGTEVTSSFALRPNGRYLALLTGLRLGENRLSASAPGSSGASASLINHPNSGPIFSGPQIPRHHCQETAVDADCNQPPEYSYLYKSSNPSKNGLQAYDPANPPSDIASTTTSEGVTLPFIVRLERGYQDRDEYRILTLFRPDQDWQPWAPQDQWNHKLVITHGGSCGTSFAPGTAPLNDYSGTIPDNPLLEQSYVTALGRGFAVLSTALDNGGHNCDVVLQAESLMMAKERLVEQYGELRYTIGTGCSGGSIAQATVANAYPGIYQGLLTMCSYPDTFTAGLQFADYHLLRLYFEDPAKWAAGVIWLPTQYGDVEGHLTHLNAVVADEGLFKGATAPSGDCYGEGSYHPESNPGGVRCGVIDALVHVFGRREPALWSPMEQAAGHGFAALPLGNAGVQYGLKALQQGRITPAQFVDLNAKIGGLDIDIKPQAERTVPDARAVANIYRSGTVNLTNNLNTVAIINFVGPDPGIAHDSVHAWWTRWRLDREHGNHDNHVMWGGPVPLIGDLQYVYQGLTAMDHWLAAIEQDASPAPIAEKIVRNKPADIHDQCSDGLGQKLLDEVCVDVLQQIYAYGTPRTMAGDGITGDSMQCLLKPFSRDDDYGLIPFTEAQWQQLEATFAEGVCDYSQPTPGMQPTQTWLRYRDDQGQVITGGAPLPPLPANSRGGWSSPAFVY